MPGGGKEERGVTCRAAGSVVGRWIKPVRSIAMSPGVSGMSRRNQPATTSGKRHRRQRAGGPHARCSGKRLRRSRYDSYGACVSTENEANAPAELCASEGWRGYPA